jgi:hypothetical protein
MSKVQPCFVTGSGLATAWANVLTTLQDRHHSEVAPLFLRIESLEGGDDGEDASLRGALDAVLLKEGKSGIETVANTIFPERRWKASGGDRHLLFRDFLRAYPRLIKIDTSNRKGTYFGRLIEPAHDVPEGQLERIIQLYNSHSGVVKMKLQAAIFRADLDHERSARPSFPCMQQVSFLPHEKYLSLNAFYASQQLVTKAYGNYLGLLRLGRFMASQMGLTLDSVNVFVGVAKVGEVSQASKEFAALVASAIACTKSEERSVIG